MRNTFGYLGTLQARWSRRHIEGGGEIKPGPDQWKLSRKTLCFSLQERNGIVVGLHFLTHFHGSEFFATYCITELIHTLKMDASCSSETPVSVSNTTLRHSSQDISMKITIARNSKLTQFRKCSHRSNLLFLLSAAHLRYQMVK